MRIPTYLLAAATFLPTLAVSAPSCPATATAESEVIKTMQGLFDALRDEDTAKFHKIVTADFYAFDAGLQLPGDALLEGIKHEHAAGRVFEWSVTQPRVHLACRQAWI